MKATEVTAGLAESNGSSLLPGIWRDSLHVTCGLTACTPGSTPGPTLGNEYGKLYLLDGPARQTYSRIVLCWMLGVTRIKKAASPEVNSTYSAVSIRRFNKINYSQ